MGETAYEELRRLYHSGSKRDITRDLINLALYEYMEDTGNPLSSDSAMLRDIVGEHFLIPFEDDIQCAYAQYEDDYCEDPCEGWDCYDERCECERARVKWDEYGYAMRIDSDDEGEASDYE